VTNDLANAARIMSERIVRLEAHQGINEQKIEEQTREIERLRDSVVRLNQELDTKREEMGDE